MDVPVQTIPLSEAEARIHLVRWMSERRQVAAVAYTNARVQMTVSSAFIAHVDDHVHLRGTPNGGIDVLLTIADTECSLATRDTAESLKEFYQLDVPAGSRLMSFKCPDGWTVILIAAAEARPGENPPDGQKTDGSFQRSRDCG